MTALRYPTALWDKPSSGAKVNWCFRWIKTRYHQPALTPTDNFQYDVVLPDGWTQAVIEDYALNYADALIWFGDARYPMTKEKLAPFTRREAIAAVRAARAANPNWKSIPITAVRNADGWEWDTTLGAYYDTKSVPVWRAP
jgi:hypothetical protein